MTPDRHPPKLATRFFRFFCHDHFYEEFRGDLEETFQSNLEAHGPAYARKVYWKEVVLLLRPSFIKKLDLFAPFKFSPDMISYRNVCGAFCHCHDQ